MAGLEAAPERRGGGVWRHLLFCRVALGGWWRVEEERLWRAGRRVDGLVTERADSAAARGALIVAGIKSMLAQNPEVLYRIQYMGFRT